MGITLRDTFPAVRQGYGFPSFLRLSSSIILTAAKTGLDQLTISPALKRCNAGQALTVASGTLFVENLGAATSGNWTFGLMKNGVQVGTFTVPYAGGGVSGAVDVDLRTPSNVGVRYSVGDIIRFDLTGVPTGVTTGLSVVKLTLTCEAYAIDC